MPDTTIRDQLAALIDDDLTRQVKVHASYISHLDQHELADAVIAAGWRPPARIAEPYVPDLVAEREAREAGVRIGELERDLRRARAQIAELSGLLDDQRTEIGDKCEAINRLREQRRTRDDRIAELEQQANAGDR